MTEADMAEGRAPEGPVLQGRAPEGPVLQGRAPEGPVLEGRAPEGPVLQGRAPEGPVLEGRAPEGRIPDRRRVAAVIIRDGCVLMVRERGKGAAGQHDGPEYWTLPGGGVEAGEQLEDAVRREVAEEVGLRALEVRYAYDSPYPSGRTSCFRVEVAPGEPLLGVDEDLRCDCPRMVGLVWVPLSRSTAGDGVMVPTLLTAAEI